MFHVEHFVIEWLPSMVPLRSKQVI